MLEKDLIEIYKEASKFFYNNTKNIGQKSDHWTRYNLKEFTPENLSNFRKKKKLSDGLDDQTDNFSFKIYSEIVEQTSEPFILKNLPSKNVGNSDIIFPYKEKYMDYNKLIHIYWFWLLENKVFNNVKINNTRLGFAIFQKKEEYLYPLAKYPLLLHKPFYPQKIRIFTITQV